MAQDTHHRPPYVSQVSYATPVASQQSVWPLSQPSPHRSSLLAHFPPSDTTTAASVGYVHRIQKSSSIGLDAFSSMAPPAGPSTRSQFSIASRPSSPSQLVPPSANAFSRTHASESIGRQQQQQSSQSGTSSYRPPLPLLHSPPSTLLASNPSSFSSSPGHHFSRSSTSSSSSLHPSARHSRTRTLRMASFLRKSWPVLMYGFTTLFFVVAIAFWRQEVFTALDDLSFWLREDEQMGYAIIFMLIFLTTIPPIPLYSTFITLSGYTFGAWTGAVISYFAALFGAIIVFAVSRTLFRAPISRWLSSTLTLKRVVRAIERRPKLLFLIRLAPYPYNVMNCLLAATPTLSMRTYMLCTALSLPKVIVHTTIGASIHSFKDYHAAATANAASLHKGSLGSSSTQITTAQTAPEGGAGDTDLLARVFTVGGVILCIAIFIYISIVARRAVDDELDDIVVDDCARGRRRRAAGRDSEERVAFLSSSPDDEAEEEEQQEMMTEANTRPISPLPLSLTQFSS